MTEIAWEASMLVIWLGGLLIVSRLVFMAASPSGENGYRSRSAVESDTLEPRRSGAGFGLATSWPGLALIALGAILLLVGAAF